MTGRLFSFGHGYSAQALAQLLQPKGWHITGTTQGERKAPVGFANHIMIWPGEDVRPYLNRATHLLISIAPDAQGDPVLRALGRVIAEHARRLEWVGYLSTTAVYGDRQGDLVDETTAPDASTERGRLRVQAEAEWQATGLPLHIFRLAGIYGPGRGPFAKVRAGTARRIIKRDQVFSRIHVEDLAQGLAASIAHPNPGAIYNFCDDEAAPPQDVIAHAAQLLNVPVPAAECFETARMTPMARSFYAESKRVCNSRLKSELGVRLKYPNYRVGLQALLRAEQSRGENG
jgi:nucleoside-diphosphate-sugar epimerase